MLAYSYVEGRFYPLYKISLIYPLDTLKRIDDNEYSSFHDEKDDLLKLEKIKWLTENHKRSRMVYFRAVIIGAVSNLLSLFTGESSSVTYVFAKENNT